MDVLLFLAQGFEHIESGAFIDVMGWARHVFREDVRIATCGFTREVGSSFGPDVAADRLMDCVHADDFAALAIPGGFQAFGFFRHAYDERLLALIREFDVRCKPIAAVCTAALALGKSGVLRGRAATTYMLEARWAEQLRAYGADVRNEPIVRDRNIITSRGPGGAVPAAFALLEELTSQSCAQSVKEAMGF